MFWLISPPQPLAELTPPSLPAVPALLGLREARPPFYPKSPLAAALLFLYPRPEYHDERGSIIGSLEAQHRLAADGEREKRAGEIS